jgi:hypothetical protein
MYTIEDLQKILNISLLNGSGYKISSLVGLSSQELHGRIIDNSDPEFQYKRAINQLLIGLYAHDFAGFERTLDAAVFNLGIDITIRNIIVPFMETIDLLSYNDHGNQTHFVVGAIRKKLMSGIENAKPAMQMNIDSLLLLPEGEHYDLVLLYNTYLLKSMGARVLYLGTNIPFRNLKELRSLRSPNLIVTYLPQKSRHKPADLSAIYQEYFPGSDIFITRPERKTYDDLPGKNARVIHFSEIENLIQTYHPVEVC